MDINRMFTETIERSEHFEEISYLIRNNSLGEIWLVGEMVYRNLAKAKWELPYYGKDFDFLVESYAQKQYSTLLPGWETDKNIFGSRRLTNGSINVDFGLLSKTFQTIICGFDEIGSYLTLVPFTVQSIAYDFKNKILVGKQGINAVLNKRVEVNNLGSARRKAEKKGKSIQDLIDEKARELKFNQFA